MRPAQHYTMGGVRTNHTGESPTLKGLFAAGEAACWDMHGFNRLGGNSVAETVVAGMIVGEYIADFCDRPENDVNIPTGLVRDFLTREQAKLDGILLGIGHRGCQRDQGADAGDHDRQGRHFPHRQGPRAGGRRAAEAAGRSRNIGLKSRAPGVNPELVTAYRVQRMLKLALCVAYGALQRTESRGAHFREDFPRRNDAAVAEAHARHLEGRDDTLPTLDYEALDVKRMELPPGWRGYGAKDYTDHPDTAARQAEVEAVEAEDHRPLRAAARADAVRAPAARAASREKRKNRRTVCPGPASPAEDAPEPVFRESE